MIGLWGDSVILEVSGGRRVSVKLDDLRGDSRIQAQKLAEGLKNSRAVGSRNCRGRPRRLRRRPPIRCLNPRRHLPTPRRQQDAQPDEFLEQLETAVKGGHVVAIFDALPPSYRNDVNEIVKLAAQKIDPNTWQSLVGTAHRLGDLIVTHQRWFLSSPRIEALPPDQRDKIEGEVLSFAGLLRDGLSPEAMQLDQLQTMDFGQWLAGRDQAIAPHLAGSFNSSAVVLVDRSRSIRQQDGTAVVTIDQNGVTSKVTYTLVEGYWVPKTIADKWAESVESWKQELADTPAGTLLGNYALMLEPIQSMLEPLANARDAGKIPRGNGNDLGAGRNNRNQRRDDARQEYQPCQSWWRGQTDTMNSAADTTMQMGMDMQMEEEMARQMEQEMQSQGSQQP